MNLNFTDVEMWKNMQHKVDEMQCLVHSTFLAFNHNCVCIVTQGDKFSYLENIFRILFFPMMSNKGAW